MSVLFAAASAAPQQYRGGESAYQTTPVPILKYDSQKGPDGSYQYGYETGACIYSINPIYDTSYYSINPI